jgi:Tfp pilus assembly protein PilV
MHRQQAGVSLVEALVALVIMSFGMITLIGLQSTMRLSADVARQRSEAVRIAHSEAERLRSFTTMVTTTGQLAYADVGATTSPIQINGSATNTTFELSREVTTTTNPDTKTLQVRVQWLDRNGQTQTVVLDAAVAGLDPALSGSLFLRPLGKPLREPKNRSLQIPPEARDLGDGTSAFRPPGDTLRVFIFSNATGEVTRFCYVTNPAIINAQLTLNDLVSCFDANGHYLAGQVQFLDAGPTTSARSERPDGHPLNLDMLLTLTSTGHPNPGHECHDDAPTTAAKAQIRLPVQYHCVVLSNTQAKWSGQLTVQPRAFTDTGALWAVTRTGENLRKVCRYTTLATDTGANILHPLHYVDVAKGTALLHQNFLVIPADLECPADVAANPAQGDFINSNTRQHQPVVVP